MFENASIVSITPTWTVVEIRNKEEAIKFGRQQWCTARPHQTYYEDHYSKGRLIAFFKNDKARPQYQLYVNHPYVEFKDGGNLSASIGAMTVMYPELEPVFEQLKVAVKKPRPFFDDFKDNQLQRYLPRTAAAPYSDQQIIDAAKKKIDLATMMEELSSIEFVPLKSELPIQMEEGDLFFVSELSQYAVRNNNQWVTFTYSCMF